MKLTVIRHGETVGNVQHLVQSHTGGELTELGRKQAAGAAQQIDVARFTAVYCSDLRRCIQTAEIVVGDDAQLTLAPKLRERDLGAYEGKHWEDVPFVEYEGEYVGKRMPDGESWMDVYCRIGKLLNELYAKHANEPILLVTHGGPVKAIRALLTPNISLAESIDMPILNGSIFEAEMSGIITNL